MLWRQFSPRLLLTMTALGCLIAVLVICMLASSGVYAKVTRSKCYRSTVDTSNSTLELLHIVFRHGPRTPVDTYPNDPYINDTFQPTGWGHITNKGKRELYELGSWLRRRYGNYLEPFYAPDRVHAQATASPRALMSLATVLASFFPPRDTPMEWQRKLNWQPIPIFSQPLEQDSLLLVRTSCPRYFEARDEVLRRPEVIDELAQFDEMLRNLTTITGMPVLSADDVNSLYITLLAEKEFGLELPEWTRDYFPSKMQFLAEQSYVYNAYTDEMQRIKGGPFLRKMYDEMLAKRAGSLSPVSRKLFIYTGHDWTVGNILSALKVWQRQMPRFSVMAIFELHRHRLTGDHYVQIFLRNEADGCLRPLKVPGCTLKCPLDKLISLSAPVLPGPETYEERCKATQSDFVEPPPRPIDQGADQAQN